MEIGKQAGHSMNILDVGGGFSGSDISESLANDLKTLKNDNFELIAEPGRYISSNCMSILTKVIGCERELKNNITINDGVYHSLNKIWLDDISLHD
jgi:ornithine decarboxylase